MKERQKNRNGAALIVAIAVFVFSSSILLMLLTSSLRARRQVRLDVQQQQTYWLLDAAIRHGMKKYQSDPDYAGEMLPISGGVDKYTEVTVKIDLERSDDRTRKEMNFMVSVGYQNSNKPPIRLWKTVSLPLEARRKRANNDDK